MEAGLYIIIHNMFSIFINLFFFMLILLMMLAMIVIYIYVILSVLIFISYNLKLNTLFKVSSNARTYMNMSFMYIYGISKEDINEYKNKNLIQ